MKKKINKYIKKPKKKFWYLNTGMVDGEKYYRVRMGPYASRSEAEENAVRAKYKGAVDAKVVID